MGNFFLKADAPLDTDSSFWELMELFEAALMTTGFLNQNQRKYLISSFKPTVSI